MQSFAMLLFHDGLRAFFFNYYLILCLINKSEIGEDKSKMCFFLSA